jgi:hypothetical protein
MLPFLLDAYQKVFKKPGDRKSKTTGSEASRSS